MADAYTNPSSSETGLPKGRSGESYLPGYENTDYAGALADMGALTGEARRAYAESKGMDPDKFQNYINQVYSNGNNTSTTQSSNFYIENPMTYSGSGAGETQSYISAQPNDFTTTYVDANGVEQTGIIRNGKTLDANGNEIQGTFTVKAANGDYWQKNADGTSTKLDATTGGDIFGNAQKAKAAENIYSGTGGATGNAGTAGNQNVVAPEERSAETAKHAMLKRLYGENEGVNPDGSLTYSVGNDKTATMKPHTDEYGRYWTVITRADGIRLPGYIENGRTYFQNGSRLMEGDSVVGINGQVYTKGKSGADPNANNMLTDEGQAWLNDDSPSGAKAMNGSIYNPDAEEGWKNGSYQIWKDGAVTISDEKGNIRAMIDSAGNIHTLSEESTTVDPNDGSGRGWYSPEHRAESIKEERRWAEIAKDAILKTGYKFSGNGDEYHNGVGDDSNMPNVLSEIYHDKITADAWLAQGHEHLKDTYPDAQFVYSKYQLEALPAGTKIFWIGREPISSQDTDIPPGLVVVGQKGDSSKFVTGGGGEHYDFDKGEWRNYYLGPDIGWVSGKDYATGKYNQGSEAEQFYNPPREGGQGGSGGQGGTGGQGKTPSALESLTESITDNNAGTQATIDHLNSLIAEYGNDYDGLRERLMEEYGTGNLDEIRALIQDTPETQLEFNYEPSDAYKEAEAAYYDATSDANRPELNFTDPERNYEDYAPTDYTQQIQQIYDDKFNAAKTQIENQLAQGELDIDQAIAKVPGIYEAGMNDMSTQFEMNKRNANEYFAANGLTSGARAQALLAMNNVYQTNMSAYRLEQANAIQEYEDKRADLRLQTQSAITEAMLQNEVERASALMDEYKRQDEYNFKFLLQKMDDDFKYWAQQCDNEYKRATFEQNWLEFKADASAQIMKMEEDRRAEDNRLRLQAAEFAENQRQFTISTGLDLAKIEETMRQNRINTELSIAELAQKDAQFKINASMNVAQLAEQMRQFGIDTSISLAKLAEQSREFDINTEMSKAELAEKIHQFTENLKLQQRELDIKEKQVDANTALSQAELNEKIREADMNYNAAIAKLTEKKTQSSGGGYTPPDNSAYDELKAIAADILNVQNNNDNYYDDGMSDVEVASNLVAQFLANHKNEGWTEDMVWSVLSPYIDK